MTRYLIWSHEHGAWWGPGPPLTQSVSAAGRYSRAAAMRICGGALPGSGKAKYNRKEPWM